MFFKQKDETNKKFNDFRKAQKAYSQKQAHGA
jgi:hypothetical protein